MQPFLLQKSGYDSPCLFSKYVYSFVIPKQHIPAAARESATAVGSTLPKTANTSIREHFTIIATLSHMPNTLTLLSDFIKPKNTEINPIKNPAALDAKDKTETLK